MKENIQKIKVLPRTFYDIVSGPPQRYWGVFLLCFLFIFLVVIMLNIFTYRETVSHRARDASFEARATMRHVNERGLNVMIETFSRNETQLQKILEAPKIKDPSIE